MYPRYVKKALELLQLDPARSWTLSRLAAASGVGSRTLQRQFRRILGRTPLEFLRDIRIEQARQELLRAEPGVTVTHIAARCGFAHPGRFAKCYRERFHESPAQTLRRARTGLTGTAPVLPLLSSSFERPTVAVLPFQLLGEEAWRAGAITEEIAAALVRLRWLKVTAPIHARYRVRGKVHGNGAGRLRVTALLVDAVTGRILWADHWDGTGEDAFRFEERVASRLARAIEPALREAEIDRVSGKDADLQGAWELSMRALPGVLSYERNAEATALELLERAMEIAPHDPLPAALAAWCRGVRGSLHFTPRPAHEKQAALRLAKNAALLNKGDALTETVLTAAYTLAHDLETAAIHGERALALDGGSAWAWGRSGWVSAFQGDGATAIERFKIARAIAPADPMSAMCCFGIASPYYEAGRFSEAIPWLKRGMAESPNAIWIKPFVAAAYALESRRTEARRMLDDWRRQFPDMTVAQFRSGLPFRPSLFDRVAEGLDHLGMRG